MGQVTYEFSGYDDWAMTNQEASESHVFPSNGWSLATKPARHGCHLRGIAGRFGSSQGGDCGDGTSKHLTMI